ncbi:microfibril-associated glycoprotein 4-like [Ciona intestinalis]
MCLNSEPFRVLSSVQTGDQNRSLKLNSTVTEILPSAFRVVLERADGMPGWDLDSVTIIWTLYMKSDIRNCQDLYEVGERKSGVYIVYLEGNEAEIKVFCDMETDGGGWTVFQRRTDGSLSFNRNWSEYTTGFGNLDAEFWLGLDFLEFATEKGNFELRIDMTGCLNETKYAQYTSFKVGGPPSYKLFLSGYKGSVAFNSFGSHNEYTFSTFDHKSSGDTRNCAETYHAGWWFKDCSFANLNGIYQPCEASSMVLNCRQVKQYSSELGRSKSANLGSSFKNSTNNLVGAIRGKLSTVGNEGLERQNRSAAKMIIICNLRALPESQRCRARGNKTGQEIARD